MAGLFSLVSQKGNWSKTFKWLDNILEKKYINILHKYGQLGVERLSAATPVDSGKTASSWEYEIEQHVDDDGSHSYSIVWNNTNVVNNGRYTVNVAVLLQYGHATRGQHGKRDGGWVQGIDYINPALEPVFQALADAAWKEVNDA